MLLLVTTLWQRSSNRKLIKHESYIVSLSSVKKYGAHEEELGGMRVFLEASCVWFLVWLFLWLPGFFVGAHRLSGPMACGILVS